MLTIHHSLTNDEMWILTCMITLIRKAG